MKKVTGNFKGTIDDLLNHCSSLDINAVEEQTKNIKEDNILEIKKLYGDMSDEEAEKIVNEIYYNAIVKACNQMESDGLIECIGHDEDGSPIYKSVE